MAGTSVLNIVICLRLLLNRRYTKLYTRDSQRTLIYRRKSIAIALSTTLDLNNQYSTLGCFKNIKSVTN